LLHQSGYEIIFADAADSLIKRMNSTPSYKVIEMGSEGTKEITITNYRAVNHKTHEDDIVNAISAADIVTCSVGQSVLKFIAPVIAKGIGRRTNNVPLYVIACEDAVAATDILAEHIKDPRHTSPERLEDLHLRARFANCVTDKIVPPQDPNAGLDVKVEEFFELAVDQTPFDDISIPPIEGIRWVNDLSPFHLRRLYTFSTGRAAAAYHGYNRKQNTVHDALKDTNIMKEVRGVLNETSSLIDAEDQAAYVEKTLKRLSNPSLELETERAGRDPLRKLSRKECLIGPAAELAEKDQPIKFLLDAIEMCLRFQNVDQDEESKELADLMSQSSADNIVSKVCGIRADDKLYSQLLQVVKRVQGGK
jgi:mannitol-1-phosphate 5-dehydrogenase